METTAANTRTDERTLDARVKLYYDLHAPARTEINFNEQRKAFR